MKVVFGICCRCVSEENKQDIKTLVENIDNFHNDVEIHVVDSSSPDKSYFKEIEDKAIIHDIDNTNFESGMIWHVYLNVPADVYVFLQDSCNITGSLEKYFNDELRLLPWKKPDFKVGSESGTVNGKRFVRPGMKREMDRMIGLTNYNNLLGEEYEIVLCNIFLTQRKIMDKFYEKNLHLALAQNKSGSEGTERTFGMAFHQEGITDFPSRLFEDGLIRKTWRRRT